MYKLLLSSRYLRTRFIALASIISVMLGVATMIVVNSVMAGFRHQMRERLHSMLSDVVIESTSTDGAPNPRQLVDLAMSAAGEHIEAITPTVEIYGMLTFEWGRKQIHQPITLIGIEPQGHDLVGPIREFLLGRNPVIGDNGQVIKPALWPEREPLSWELSSEAAQHRSDWQEVRRLEEEVFGSVEPQTPFFAPGPEVATDHDAAAPNPFDHSDDPAPQAVPALRQTAEVPSGSHARVRNGSRLMPDQIFGGSPAASRPADPGAPFPARAYVGVGLISYQYPNDQTGETETMMFVRPGEDVNISTIKSGIPDPSRFTATVVDVFRSGMSEFDSSFVFCNLEELQKVRGMIDPVTGEGAVTMLKIRLKDYNSAADVVRKLRTVFDPRQFSVYTWEQKRAPLLQAVEVESAILNVLLFLIIAVAGFGILAIFYMIVVEKTRDIGILKALGASSRGVMAIFLTYGLSLGVVGSGVGVILGLLFVRYINEIEGVLSWLTGRKVFDETIYYFRDIPTSVHPLMVLWVALGAMAIAVLASVLPARRASRLNPVQALRYE